MQSKKLKMCALVVAFCMIFTLFTGCGEKKEAQNNSNETNQQTKSADNAKKEEPIEIEWLAYQTSAQPNPDAEIVKMVEDRFNAKFKFWYIDHKRWDDSLNVKLAAGEMPDVLWLQNPKVLGKYVEQGILGEISEEKIRELAPNYAKVMDKYNTEENTQGLLWKTMKYNGKNYGFSLISLNGAYPKNVVWRKDWLENVGIEKIPETIDEFETALYKFRNDDPDKNNKKDTYGLADKSFEAIFGAYGLLMNTKIGNIQGDSIMLKDGDPVFSAIQPEAKDALSLLQKWYKDEIIDPEFVTGENHGGYVHMSHAFANGRIGLTGRVMFYHYAPANSFVEQGGKCYREVKKVNSDAQMVLGAPPIGPDGKSGTPKWGVIGARIGLTSKCVKNERKVKTILKMLDTMFTDEEYCKTVWYGLEGKHHKFDENNALVKLKRDYDPREDGVYVFCFLNGSPEVAKKCRPNYYEFANKHANFPGYIEPPVPSTEEAMKYNETLKKMAEEAYMDIITGSKDVDYFDEFVEKFRKNGGDEVEKAMAEAYNKMIQD